MVSQESLFNIPRETEDLYVKLGISKDDFQNTVNPKIGLPAQSENTLIGFFPKLTVGIKISSGALLKLERKNQVDIYDIDYHITKDGTSIAFIDNEQRANDFPFNNKSVPLNIPYHSFQSNVEGWRQRPTSNKARYYIAWPNMCFHLTRSSDMNTAICCWAKDFSNTKPVLQNTWMGEIYVWKTPRDKTCYGKINEHTIEDWILVKLNQEGLLF